MAVLILRATIDWPARHGGAVLEAFNALGTEFLRRAEPKYEGVFPAAPTTSNAQTRPGVPGPPAQSGSSRTPVPPGASRQFGDSGTRPSQ